MKLDHSTTFHYLENIFDNKTAGYRFFKNGKVTLLSTTFVIQLRWLLNNFEGLDLRAIVNFIKDQQREDGLFIDKNFKEEDVHGFEEDYFFWQSTYFSTISLDMIGDAPKHTFKFLNAYKSKDKLKRWYEKQKFHDYWYMSNKVMFLLYFLIYENHKKIADNENIIEYFMDLLDQTQDPETGYWGTNKGSDLVNGLFGGAHIYLFYDYLNRNIQHSEKIIDHTLNLQNEYGLYVSRCGGACEEYNAVITLNLLSKQTDYRSKDVDDSLKKIYSIIIENQKKDGGYSYAFDKRTCIQRAKDIVKQRKYLYKYSGWNKMESDRFRSDVWGTYFRYLTLATISKKLKYDGYAKYKFYNLPGWGYF